MPLTELLRTLLFSFTFILLTRVFTVFLLATALSFPKSKQQWNPQGPQSFILNTYPQNFIGRGVPDKWKYGNLQGPPVRSLLLSPMTGAHKILFVS